MLWVVVEILSLAIPALQGGFSVFRWAHSKLTRSKRVALPAHLEGPIATGAVAVGTELRVIQQLTWTDAATVDFCVQPESVGLAEGARVRIVGLGRGWMRVVEVTAVGSD